MANWDLEKHAKMESKKAKKTKKRKKGGCFLVFIFLMLIMFAGLGAGIGALFGFLDTASDINIDDYLITDNISTYFYDREGNEIGIAHGGENRTVASLDEIPYYLQKAFISIEDERFYDHNGIDYKRTLGAIISYIKTKGEGTYGGSTITQQLIKNVTEDKEKNAMRKVREWWRALQLEKELSKEQILELYLNTINFGKGAYGVKTAAKVYYNKDVKDLSLAECALLAGIPNRPTKYNPFTNFDNAKTRQEVILNKMLELGYINQEQCNTAKEEKIVIEEGKAQTAAIQSYFVDMVIEDVINDLMEKERITRTAASNMIYGGDLKIYTTMDPKVQAAIDDTYITHDAEVFAAFKNQAEQPQSAMVIIDYTTGQIVGIAGGRGEKKENRGFNYATMAFRQPGSTIKPLAVYGPALNDKIVTAASLVDDSPLTVKIPGSKSWTPTNWYGYYYGNVTIRRAIERSMNIPAVKILMKVGINRSYEALKSVGITTLTSNDLNYSPLSLGGLTKGINVREWTAAYGMIANNGSFNKGISYTKVIDSKGQIVLQNKISPVRVMSEQSAFILKDILRTVVTNGTATTAKLNGMTAAGKTGSTQENIDKWFVGFTPYYVGGVWTGYDERKSVTVGSEISKQVWKRVMTKIHEGKSDPGFVPPNGVTKVSICKASGLRSTGYCSDITNEWFISDTVPGFCTVHSYVPVYEETAVVY